MERTYCDRCGEWVDRTEVILKNWVAYYDRRLDQYYSYSYGTFKQTVCDACLDDLIPVFNSKVAREPVDKVEYVQPIVSVPLSEGCSGCWLCRLKRYFRGKK